ncbi:A-kinase anchor protein 7-like isoform X2 [Lineus longissimus]
MASTVESQKSEVEALSAKYGKECRVIADVGDFTYIVTIKLPQVSLKFQLDVSYPKLAPQIIASSSIHKENTLHDLTSRLLEETLSRVGGAMIDSLVSVASDWLNEVAPVMEVNVDETKTKKKGKQKGKKKTKSKNEDVDETLHKKPSMKTATDVISRIMWDDSLEKDDFLVGYIDRFRGLLERSFAEFSWEDLASVDYDVLAIPKHRIEYFKYKEVKVWDKPSRVDNVFGSSGDKKLTIQKVIANYDEERARLPAASEGGVAGNLVVQDDVSYDSDSDSDDGIVVSIGGANNDCGYEDQETDSDDFSSESWGNKLRPNYFIAVRITDPEIIGMVSHIQDVLSEREPRYQECCIGPKALHVTLCTLRIDTQEQLADVTDQLRSEAQELKSSARGLKLKFEGIDNFFHRVLYAKVHHGDDFTAFVDEVKLVLRTGGIEIRDNYDFVPHMTLMKVSRPVARAMGTKNISPHIYSGSEDIIFGEQMVDALHLCSMKEEKGADGFYYCPLSLPF